MAGNALGRSRLPRSLKKLYETGRALGSTGPFVPLLLRGLMRSRNDALLGVVTERQPLTEQVRHLPPSAVIVQRFPPEPDVTVALATGCQGTERRVLVEWPEPELATEPGRRRFREWHRAVISDGLLPYLAVRRRVDLDVDEAAMVYPRTPAVTRGRDGTP